MIETKEETETIGEEVPPSPPEDVECRACLQRFDYEAGLLDMFQAWEPPWNGMGESIAQDLARLANVNITIADSYSKLICQFCHQKLLEACSFVVNVRINDRLLRRGAETLHEQDDTWPKPIQVDRNINSNVFNSTMDVEIKQEVLSEDEIYPSGAEDTFKDGTDVAGGTDNTFNNMEIKIEPEEIIQPAPFQITVNGTITHDQFERNSILTNGEHKEETEQDLENVQVKQEPRSEEEEVEPPPDLSLECMLCTKSFNSVTGLKAHVIAQHSYKTVKRKSEEEVSAGSSKRSGKHVCVTCRRSFTTPTDLMVHETCHNTHACYGCNYKCDTFQQLSRHRLRCKALRNNAPLRHKTLHDVTRPQIDSPLLIESCSRPTDSHNDSEKKDSDSHSNNIDVDMKVERIESMSSDESHP
ncbi:hypothetical protein O3G_MSEX010843 [Manduca sexta]|uniref:Uncharacterized protein n=1 Tax=Manduca sexta TaxID=7130 RepID=A0A921ZHZ4_MANSE|nr:hypothetical protein O3G_MSEX010843 [Manduca sexta]KAG6458383.1 hypothetical protein O3G_MSEX010843 [Manduca sexta]